MSLITNFSDDFIRNIVSSVNLAVTDDIKQDTRQLRMERSKMNSYPSRIWDLINRNICVAFANNANVVVNFTNRGPWKLIAIFDKMTGMLITLMREERFCSIKKNTDYRKHYINQLASMFNADLDNVQQSFFVRNYDKDISKKTVEHICNDLFISTEMVQHHAVVLFSVNNELLHSMRCCMINKFFEEFESVSWNEYIKISESIVVEQVTNKDPKKNDPTLGLEYTQRAKRKKRLNHNISAMAESNTFEAE